MFTLNVLLEAGRSKQILTSLARRVTERRIAQRRPSRCFALLALSASIAASAQIPSVTDVTTPPVPNVGHDYIQENVETVNPANGSLSIRIGAPLPLV